MDEAFARVHDSRFGLQAGVSTRDPSLAFRSAMEDLTEESVLVLTGIDA